MHLPQITFLLWVLSASVTTRAQDVTLYEAAISSKTRESGQPHATYSIIGATPLSVDSAGATHYAYSLVASFDWVTSTEVLTVTQMVQDDGTRAFQQETLTAPGGGEEHENTLECWNHQNGTVVCEQRIVVKFKGTHSTAMYTPVELTRTGAPIPWLTIKNVGSHLPSTGDDDSSAAKLGASAFVPGIVFMVFSILA